MTLNSRIHNLYKAIDWIEKQSLGQKGNRLETQAIDWNKIQLLRNQAIDWNSITFTETCSDKLNGIKPVCAHYFFILMLKQHNQS